MMDERASSLPSDEILSGMENHEKEENRSFFLHWVIFVGPVLGVALSICVSVGILVGVHVFLPEIDPQALFALRLAMLGIIILSAGGIANASLARATTTFRVYQDRVVLETGWLSKNSMRAFIVDIIGCDVAQSAMGRILNYGTVIVDSKGVDRLWARSISNPGGAAKLIFWLKSENDRKRNSGDKSSISASD